MKRLALNGKNQLTIGDVIDRLKNISLEYENHNGDIVEKSIMFDFADAMIYNIGSWRGAYDELELRPTLEIMDYNYTAKKLLEKLITIVEQRIPFEGWKGGEYIYDYYTPVWVSLPRNGSNTAVTDVYDLGWKIVLETSYCEY